MTENPIRHSPKLGRRIRQDGLETLGISTQTLFERAVEAGAWDVADELADYFWFEIKTINEALFSWLEDLLTFRLERAGTSQPDATAAGIARGLRNFNPVSGELARVHKHCANHDSSAALIALEALRAGFCPLHDAYVVWIQEILTELAKDFGEYSILVAVERASHRLWKVRYAVWPTMEPIERLQLSVEGMRGHLSGPRRRGDVGVAEEPDRFVMTLDPCGSCGILRRGDPVSGRAPYCPAGNETPHPWTWGLAGKGWYSVHSPIVMEYLPMSQGAPPFRPLENCDTAGPCRWFIYKDPTQARPEHYQRMGFAPPR